MSPADLGFVVREHRRHFPHGFFARLGGGFLREYYRAFLTSAKSRTVVAELDGAPVGYLVGVTDPAAHRSHVVHRHGRVLVARAVAAMLVRPSLAFRFLRTRVGLYTRKLLRRGPRVPSGGSVEASDDGCATAVLTHVAVTPEAQSIGIGTELIDRFDREVAGVGCDRLALVTASGDDGAGPYYRRRGWTPRGDRSTPDGLRLTTYERPVEATNDQDYPWRSEGTA
ncbi:MAG TPA: GNAT family N-acetyltransferase [Nocardioidaceae bacterium]|nr:GNAT family N-acetyltransferase [Nocardioidaceae bacterium]